MVKHIFHKPSTSSTPNPSTPVGAFNEETTKSLRAKNAAARVILTEARRTRSSQPHRSSSIIPSSEGETEEELANVRDDDVEAEEIFGKDGDSSAVESDDEDDVPSAPKPNSVSLSAFIFSISNIYFTSHRILPCRISQTDALF